MLNPCVKTRPVTEATRFSARVRRSLREALLDAAANLLAEHGFAGLRMADVAEAAGVSRQTVYNEFGGKQALAQSVALRTLAEFLDGVDQRMKRADDALSGLHASIVYTIEHASGNRLLASIIGSDQADDLLPLLTTRGEPVLRPSVDQLAANLRARAPWLAPAAAGLVAETAVRLAISHLLLPTGDARHAADAVCAVLAPSVVEHSPTNEVHNGL